MSTTFKSKMLAAAAMLTLAGSLGLAGAASAASASTPLPAYPAATTLDLGSPNCITDDVILNDPVTSPVTVTYGSDGSPVVFSQATPPVTYYMWYLNTSNTWQPAPPPGVQINPVTGVISAEGNGAPAISGDQQGGAALLGSITYTIRVHGKDSLGAIGTEQFQVTVNAGATATSVSYAGNDFDNANGALTIQLNGGSTTSTALTIAAVAGSLNIPGSTPVTFSLHGTNTGWNLSSSGVLTGVGASDPNLEAVTANHDVVFFHLSGLSTDAGGIFYLNSDANPCVTGPVPAPSPSPTASTPPPPVTPDFGDNVNPFGNGFDVYRQHAAVGTPVIGWPATQHDPATHFLKEAEGSHFRFEYAPAGTGTGLCVSNPGDGALVLRGCNAGVWQQFDYAAGHVISVVSGGIVNPDGTGAQLTAGPAAVPWGGSRYAWTAFASLPA